MTPPRVCPRPQGPDCPLYEKRLGFSDSDEVLRHAILAELSQGRPSLAHLIRAEIVAADAPGQGEPPQPLLLPAPAPVPPLFIHHRAKRSAP